MSPGNKRITEVLAGILIGTTVLVGVAVYLNTGRLNQESLNGVLCGLLGGFFFVVGAKSARRHSRRPVLLFTLTIVTSPLGSLFFLPFSAKLASGYVLGLAITAPLAWAIWELADTGSNGRDRARP